MIFLYNTGIFLYSLIIKMLSPFNEKARFFVKGRKNWREELKQKIEQDAPYAWFHCASLGEFEQGRPVIETIKKQFPEYKIILTFFSPSGYEIRKNYSAADVIAYLPVDLKSNAKDFIQIVNPEKVFFIKYEFWLHYITELKNRDIPLYIISAIFRDDQLFFKNNFFGKWYRKYLKSFHYFFVQNESSGELLTGIGHTNYSVCGDTRFDRVYEIAKGVKNSPLVEKFAGSTQVIIAGSTWKADEEILTEFINNNDDLKFIIAPHEVNEANINRLQQMLIKPTLLYSKAENSDLTQFQVLIIDCIGLLSSLYQYGSVSYIGGGFGVGIHNILEAATFGMPVIFGPKFEKFQEARDLIQNGGAFSIHDFSSFESKLNQLIQDQDFLQKSSEICRKYVEKNVGSTRFIIKKVFNK